MASSAAVAARGADLSEWYVCQGVGPVAATPAAPPSPTSLPASAALASGTRAAAVVIASASTDR